MEWVERNKVEPWVIVDMKEGEEAARRILSRSISAKYCIQGIDWIGQNNADKKFQALKLKVVPKTIQDQI